MDLKTVYDSHSGSQHKVIENEPDIVHNPVNSYVLCTPSMGRSYKLLPTHKGPYQVIGVGINH